MPLDLGRFQYLEGCVCEEAPYELPPFGTQQEGPWLYISFGSLGAGDTDLLQQLIASWFPQPSVIPLVDAVIHNGGNNSFTECLHVGKPAIVISCVWEGHDNGMRLQETGHGLRSERYDWTEAGIWVCTPGAWTLSIPRDEFCHFVSGRATYTRDDGEVTEVGAGTCVTFPAGWTGHCTVHETIRNIYMLA